MLIGHSHQTFLNAASTMTSSACPTSTRRRASVHGVPTAMANFWGKTLGVIQLQLVAKDGRWSVDKTKTVVSAQHPERRSQLRHTAARGRRDSASRTSGHHRLRENADRQQRLRDDLVLRRRWRCIRDADREHGANRLRGELREADHAAVRQSAGALHRFAVQDRFCRGADFTDVAAGPIAINNAADLYLFPNTLYAVKVDGAGLGLARSCCPPLQPD